MTRRYMPILLAGFLLSSAAFAQLVEPPAVPPGGQQDRYIVTFRAGSTAAQRAASVSRAGATAQIDLRIVNAVAVRVPNANALAALQRDPDVISIAEDRPVTIFQGLGSSKSSSSKQVVPEGVKRVGVPTDSSNGSGVGVAILDTGVALNHSDLSVATAVFDAFGGNCMDQHGHGTHVAGTVAALDNTTGVLGVAPNAKIFCVKVLNDSGSGSDSTIIAGLQWVYDNRNVDSQAPIRVVNMSLGRPKYSGDMAFTGTIRGAIKVLYDAGISVVAAAGNDPNKEVSQMVPAGLPEVMAVASTTAINGSNACRWASAIQSDTASYFTTDGKLTDTTDGPIGVTISAPGEDRENISRGCLISTVGILSLAPGGGTARMSGTSMAAPHVAGVVARLYQSLPGYTPEGVRTWLRTNGSNIGSAPKHSPTSSYTFDGEHEGIAKAP
ncbi:MAG: S8 family serine peptidase [Bryobacteraceae bacterium]